MHLNAERLSGIIIGFAAVGLILTGWLVLSELLREPTCPELLGIPACYALLLAYLVTLAGAWMPDTTVSRSLFLVGAGAVTVIGAWFSFGQLAGTLECPAFEGLPMCFVSLFAGLSILALDEARRRLVQDGP